MKMEVDPFAIEGMSEIGIEISQQRASSSEGLKGLRFDIIVTVRDRARETCPVFKGVGANVHKAFEDPVIEGEEEDIRKWVRHGRDEIERMIDDRSGCGSGTLGTIDEDGTHFGNGCCHAKA